jgi:transcriptional regulator with XRE-family HTH domain
MPPSTATQFGTLLREFRERAGLDQSQLASLLKVSDLLIQKLEGGKRKPPRDLLFYYQLRDVPGFTDADIARLWIVSYSHHTEWDYKPPVEPQPFLAEVLTQPISKSRSSSPQSGRVEEAPEILTESSYKDDLIRLWGSEKGANPVQTLVKPEGDPLPHVKKELQPGNQPEREDQNNPNETTQSPRRVSRENQRAHESLDQTDKRLLRKYGEDQFILTAHRVYEDAKGIQYQAMAKNVPVKYVTIGQASEAFQIANGTLAEWVADGLLHNVTKVEHPAKPESGIVLVEPREVMKLKEKVGVGEEAAEPRLITLVEAANKFDLPYETIRNWYRSGRLPEKGREVFGTHGGGKILVDEKEIIRLTNRRTSKRKTPTKRTE